MHMGLYRGRRRSPALISSTSNVSGTLPGAAPILADHHEHTLSILEEIASTLPENGRLRGKSSYPGVQGLL